MTTQTQSQKLNQTIAVQQMKAKGEIQECDWAQLMENSGEYCSDTEGQLHAIKNQGISFADKIIAIENIISK
jgi:hypothetical protein